MDEAYRNLREALIKSNLNIIAREVLNYPSESTRWQQREFSQHPSTPVTGKLEQRELTQHPSGSFRRKLGQRKEPDDWSGFTRGKSAHSELSELPYRCIRGNLDQSGSTRRKSEQKLHQQPSAQLEQKYSFQHASLSTGCQSDKRDFSQYPSISTRRKSDQKDTLEEQSGSTRQKSERMKVREDPAEHRESLRHPSTPSTVKQEQENVSGSFRSLSKHGKISDHQSTSTSRKSEQQEFQRRPSESTTEQSEQKDLLQHGSGSTIWQPNLPQHPSEGTRRKLGQGKVVEHPRISSQFRREENIPFSHEISTKEYLEEIQETGAKTEEKSPQKRKNGLILN